MYGYHVIAAYNKAADCYNLRQKTNQRFLLINAG